MCFGVWLPGRTVRLSFQRDPKDQRKRHLQVVESDTTSGLDIVYVARPDPGFSTPLLVRPDERPPNIRSSLLSECEVGGDRPPPSPFSLRAPRPLRHIPSPSKDLPPPHSTRNLLSELVPRHNAPSFPSLLESSSLPVERKPS